MYSSWLGRGNISNKGLDESLNEGLEEERRLAGLTRARKSVDLYANTSIFMAIGYFVHSRFLKELPKKNVSTINLFFKNASNKNNSEYKRDLIGFSNLESQENSLFIGDKVFHQKFGYGIIENIEGENAEVSFSKTNIKKVKKNYLIKNA